LRVPKSAPSTAARRPARATADAIVARPIGKWSDTLVATVADAKQWVSWGASVGLQSRLYLGLDIDVEDAAAADAIEALALDYLGLAPVRFRDGSPRRLLVYKRAGEVISKRRVAYTDAAGVKHAVELLGKGQQYVVEGPHPKGGVYQWRHDESPCEWTPATLTEVDAARWTVSLPRCPPTGWKAKARRSAKASVLTAHSVIAPQEPGRPDIARRQPRACA
jgi:hypothetical protein